MPKVTQRPAPTGNSSTPKTAAQPEPSTPKAAKEPDEGLWNQSKNLWGPGWRSKNFKFEKQSFNDDRFVNAKVTNAVNERPLQPTDFEQELANCYQVSSYHAIAQSIPGLLDNAIKANGDGTFSVTFYSRIPVFGKVKHVETVTGELPNYHLSTGQGAVEADAWKMPLIEKAYAQWHGSYDRMEWGDPGKAMKNITGKSSKLVLTSLKSEDGLFKTLQRELEKKRPIVAGTLNLSEEKDGAAAERKEAKEPDLGRFSNLHCYSVVSASEQMLDGKMQKTVTVRDPRRPGEPITVSIGEFKKVFKFMRINRMRGDKYE